MKTVLMVLMGFFALITTGRGQSPSLGSGLYHSVEDFPNNHRFYDLLDAQIQNGDLTAYDATHHMTNSAGCSGRARPPLFRTEGTLPTAHMKRYPCTPKL